MSQEAYKWIPTSPDKLAQAEKQVLSTLETPYKGRYVNIGPVVGQRDCKIWTISFNERSSKCPILLIHGLSYGVGHWSLNLDKLAASGRPVYAIDNLGFGRSSRPKFSTDPHETLEQYVTVLEEWRKCVNINRFILLGHSMGGYIGTAYSLKFPQRIAHLVLVDPWGFTKRPKYGHTKYPVPLWIIVLAFFTRPFNPFWIVRTIGPLGPLMMSIIQAHVNRKYNAALNAPENVQKVQFGDYTYHCNVRRPSGENSFHCMSDFVWAKLPMIKKIPQLSPDVDLTVLYGKKSFIWRFTTEHLQRLRNCPAYTNVHILEGAGHDIFVDKPDEFNQIVLDACKMADNKFDNSQCQFHS